MAPNMSTRKIVQVPPRLKEHEPYLFDILGTPIVGYNSASTHVLDTKLSDIWRHLMRRCYDVSVPSYRYYGAKGVSVCKRWHLIDNFVADVKLLPGFNTYRLDRSVNLDKDYYGSNQYSPDTCVWLSQEDNKAYSGLAVVAITPFETTEYVSLSEAARWLCISPGLLHRYLNTPRPRLGAWSDYIFEYSNKLLRYELTGVS